MTDRIQNLIKVLGSADAKFARKAINYYDDRQAQEMVNFLSDSQSFRKNWKEKGLIPRTRNITKAVIDKSGMLFNGHQPTVEVWVGDSVDQLATDNLLKLLDSADWIEFFTNFDNQVRLLKTGLVLVQWDSENRKLILDALHRGNCVVAVDANTRTISEMLVHTSSSDDEHDAYRHFTIDKITDYSARPGSHELHIDGQFDNPYGIIPAASFHDTNTPRYGIWNVAPRDLIGLNEMYNLNLMDSEYSAAWSKVKTLFTNANISGSDTTQTMINTSTGMPYEAPAGASAVGGPGRIVQIDAGHTAVYLEYKGPDVNLQPIESIFSQWVKDFAGDWSVALDAAGDGAASSGFQLIVEEMPNLELRRTRQKMMTAGFARLYKVLTYVTGAVPGAALPPEGMLYVTFQPPQLPVDDKAQEEVWGRRITEGRASRVDYFIETKGMTREEALAKVAEIDALNSVAPAQSTRNSVVKVI